MTITILPKRSNTAAAVPTTSNLVDNEIAINTADLVIYQRVGAAIVAVANYTTWANLAGKPSTFTPAAHSFHTTADVIGLDTALAGKAPLANPAFTGTVTGITAAMVGLPDVDNTSDASKPVSAAQAAALALKANLASPTFTGTATAAQAVVGNGNVAAPMTVQRVGGTQVAQAFVHDSLTRYFGITAAGQLTYHTTADMSLGSQVWHAGTFDPTTKLDLAGGAMAGGLTFGATLAPGGATDCSRHVSLYGTAIGFSVTASRLNYNIGSTGAHEFYAGTTSTLLISDTALTYKGDAIWHAGNLPAYSQTAGTSNTLVQRNVSGYIFSNYYNTTAAFTTAAVTAVFVETGSDGYIRKMTLPEMKKQFVPNVQSVASAATVTPTFDNDMVVITAQAAALALANPTGTAADGHGIVIRIKDNGTARAISYGSQYRAVGVTLPTTTVVGKTHYLGCIWNAAETKLDVLSVGRVA